MFSLKFIQIIKEKLLSSWHTERNFLGNAKSLIFINLINLIKNLIIFENVI